MPREPSVRTICEGLIAEPNDISTAVQWARRVGTSAKTLHQLFPSETGLSFGEWRQQARLLSALERLARGEKVIEVARKSGYASHSAFTVMFRKRFGMPPSAFYR